jgi:hypothetical protein
MSADVFGLFRQNPTNIVIIERRSAQLQAFALYQGTTLVVS